MRAVLILVATLMSLSAAAQEALPLRKAGLWDLKMSFEGRGTPPQQMQQCTDNSTDKAMNQPSGGAGGSDRCTQQSLTRSGNTITVESVCQTPRGPSSTTAVISGDFNSGYTVKVATRQQGAATTNMTLDARYLGGCKPDQRPGDMIMGNGMKVNIRDMQQMRAAPGAAPPQGMPPGLPPDVQQRIQQLQKQQQR